MSKGLFGAILFFLYLAAAAAIAFVAYHGWEYYTLPLQARPRAQGHLLFKPSGVWGHGLGILGSCMLLLLFLYSVRKREFLGIRFGRLRRWLDIHIFFGLIGPIFITLHTAGKFHGVVSISYFSMLAVMLSGIFGRYIYMHIPRDPKGTALSLQQLDSKDRLMTRMLVEQYRVGPEVIREIGRLAGMQNITRRKGVLLFISLIFHDLTRRLSNYRMRKQLRALLRDASPRLVSEIIVLAEQKKLLLQRRAFLNMTRKIFHYWHVLHKPFAYIMIIIMFLHIIVTVTFGYRWIF